MNPKEEKSEVVTSVDRRIELGCVCVWEGERSLLNLNCEDGIIIKKI